MSSVPVVMVRQLLPQVIATVPPVPAPGPVPSLSARNTILPVVTVDAALTFTFCPATAVRLPVTIVVAAATLTLLPAVSVRLPVVVFVAAVTLISRTALATRLPLVAVTAAAILTSRNAVRVRVVGAVQVTASFTFTSPLTPAMPLLLRMATLAVAKLVPNAEPVMSPPAATVKSLGSINQVPVLPVADSAVMKAPGATLTYAAEVSMNPPSPPLGADTLSVPPTPTLPVCMSPMSKMVPLWFCNVCASMMPVLLTAPPSRPVAAWAVNRT